MAAPDGFDGLGMPNTDQLWRSPQGDVHREARSRLSEAGQRQPQDYRAAQQRTPEPDESSGAWAVLRDLTKGACEEVTSHPGRLLVSIGAGFLTGRLMASLSEGGMRTLGRMSAAATVWGLYKHGGGLLKSAENVWSGRADERDHETLRGLGASALDITAGGLAGLGGLATSKNTISSAITQTERRPVLSNYELPRPIVAAESRVAVPGETSAPLEPTAPLAPIVAKAAKPPTIAELKARLGAGSSRVRDQSTAGASPNDVFYDDNGYMHHLDGALRPESHGSTIHGAVHTDGHFGHDVSSHSGGGGHGGFGGGHM